MTTPSEPENGPSDGVNLSKDTDGEPFDPYRFGKPDHPIPAEYAPPGYTGPVLPPPTPYGTPPGTPYGQQPPYQYPPPSGQYGYGAPHPPPYHGYLQPRTGNGKAVAALVFGILSILFCWLSVFDGLFVILGVVFGLIAMSETRHGDGSGRGMAVAGLICAIIGAIIATILTILVIRAANHCGGIGNSNAPGFNQCVRQHF